MSAKIVQTGAFASLDSSSHLHLALAQVYASDFDVNEKDVDTSISAFQRGLNKIRAYTEKAAKEGADVVCFPEYFLTGAKLETWHAVRTEGGPRPHRADSLDDKNGSGPKRKRTMDLESEQEVSQREEEEEAHWIEEVCSLAKGTVIHPERVMTTRVAKLIDPSFPSLQSSMSTFWSVP